MASIDIRLLFDREL